MGRFNNDTKGIVLRLLWNNNIVKVCDQYRSNKCFVSNIAIFNKYYNWRDLQNRSFEGWAIWGKQHQQVGKLPKNY